MKKSHITSHGSPAPILKQKRHRGGRAGKSGSGIIPLTRFSSANTIYRRVYFHRVGADGGGMGSINSIGDCKRVHFVIAESWPFAPQVGERKARCVLHARARSRESGWLETRFGVFLHGWDCIRVPFSWDRFRWEIVFESMEIGMGRSSERFSLNF